MARQWTKELSDTATALKHKMPKRKGKSDVWKFMNDQKEEDTSRFRDVHESQQLERSELDPVRSKKPFTIMAVVLSLVVTLVTWLVISGLVFMGLMVVSSAGSMFSDPETQPGSYYVAEDEIDTSGEDGAGAHECYYPTDSEGEVTSRAQCYPNADAVPVPQWAKKQSADGAEKPVADEPSLPQQLTHFSGVKALISLLAGLLTFSVAYPKLMRTRASQNALRTTEDVNQYENDARLAHKREVPQKYNVFPDSGAHSSVNPSAILSHVMLKKKGLQSVMVPERATEDVRDNDGSIVAYAGEEMRDDNGDVVMKKKPIIDEAFGDDLFEASGVPDVGDLRHKSVAKDISYNKDNKDREKLKGFDTVEDLINGDWELPEYEVKRPSGVYVVDSSPVNTMILAITRGGKGQTYIEPMIDIWTREKRKNNIVINDPKGELMVKFYVPATVRGYQVVQFNLINSPKTDIYNPLGMAAEAARAGDTTSCATYVKNISDVFFDTSGGDDPMWNNAAANAFMRAAFGLIDYYLEEEREMRQMAQATDMDPQTLETRLDTMWGKVTLYNCYQLFVQMSSKKKKNPVDEIQKKWESGELGDDEDRFEQLKEEAMEMAELWNGEPDIDLLTLFFNATEKLPLSTMRILVANANNSLRSMGGAEKMLASVYGIAITQMSFFTDPTIMRLTSGTPSQNTDLASFSFPRRMGVRFDMNYVNREGFMGLQCKWDAFSDSGFTQSLGEDFEHDDEVSPEGWARYFFDGIFPENKGWVRLRLMDARTGLLVRTYYFEFTKSYKTSLSGRTYAKDPVTDEKIINNGVLVELVRKRGDDGTVRYERGHSTFKSTKLVMEGEQYAVEKTKTHQMTRLSAWYTEKPKILFLVTPPHMMSYAKLILILVKQLVDLNFDQSYRTKANQKPFYKTRYMLDELGNLQSEGQGIAGFQTMLSIGLGQDQQFTLILQTLQQIRDVYGDSADRIIQGNAANLVFLKSNDGAMLDELSKLSGTRHKVYRDSKTVTEDKGELAFRTEGKVSYTMSAKEEPVISVTDLVNLPERNSVIFRAGDSPIWNRNENIFPMSFALLGDTIKQPGHKYTFRTVPSLSTAMEFDVRLNQPNFQKMLEKRLFQAKWAPEAWRVYQEVYKVDDHAMSQMDPDILSNDLMNLVDSMQTGGGASDMENDPELAERLSSQYDDEEAQVSSFTSDEYIDNEDINVADAEKLGKERAERRFAGRKLSTNDLVRFVRKNDEEMMMAQDNAAVRMAIAEAYLHSRRQFAKDRRFQVEDNDLYTADGTALVHAVDQSQALEHFNEAMESTDGVYGEERVDERELAAANTLQITDDFMVWLAQCPDWSTIAGGQFERMLVRRLEAIGDSSLTAA